MNAIITIHRTYKYRLYRNDKADKHLHQQINVAGMIWNHALALQKRYYKWYHKHLGEAKLKSHIARLRMKTAKYRYWRELGSQAVQDVVERLEAAWQRFFDHQSGFPRFKKVKQYKSFTLKMTAGWKLIDYNRNELRLDGKYKRARGAVQLGEQVYKFVQHRPMTGIVKTVTVKRDACRRLWICFSVIEDVVLPEQADLSRIGGFDFGLHYFLTDHEGKRWMHPEFSRSLLHRIRSLNRSVSRKEKDSANRERARWDLARTHIRIADKRRDFHYKLAHALCNAFDVLVFEDLNLNGMKRLWGRKVSDLGFGKFLTIVRHVAERRGKQVIQIERFERTTGKCSTCGAKVDMTLKQRTFVCPDPACGLTLDRDHNAALNILNCGASQWHGLGIVSPASAGCPV